MGAIVREWEGDTVFVLAGGASVRDLDLSPLIGRRVIAINSAHRTWPQADILFFADHRWWTEIGAKEGFGGRVVTTSGGGPRDVERLLKIDPAKGIACKPTQLALARTSVTGAINLAIHLGCRRIVLLGVDGRFAGDGTRHHHGAAYPWPLVKGSFDLHAAEFRAIAPSVAAAGVEVINANPDSVIDVWPKTSFEDVVSMLDRVAIKQPLTVLSMYGMGDCLHQRAVLRDLMKTRDVELQTYYTAMYHDLIADGLKVTLVDRLAPRIRDAGNMSKTWPVARGTSETKIGYDHARTRRHGTLLAAMFGSVGLPVPDKADFSLPVKDDWRIAAWCLMDKLGHPMDVRADGRQFATINGKPLMVYRPIIINGTWPCASRSPDPEAYAALYRSIREKFFVVSVCDLTQKGEEIVGEEQEADLKLHRGEADFEALAGLFAEAALVFGNAGFAPILAQAVGTPNIVVYGGNESFRYTNAVGAHLAPTLPIEPVKPCECFDRHHKCDKTIDLGAALPKVEAFANAHGAQPRVLVFGTIFTDTPEKQRLVAQWQSLHRAVNGWSVDLLLIDSASPLPPPIVEDGVDEYAFPDNIGHLARGGRDGWGRAFCKGLEMAIDGQYDYVAHIEGDSLFKQPVLPVIREMIERGIKAASVPVMGTKRQETGWTETGLMFFSVDYLWQTKFIERYDWWNRKARPFPEQAISGLLGEDLRMLLPVKAERGDKGQITIDNAAWFDWITHCPPEAFDAFVEAAMPPPPVEVEAPAVPDVPAIKLNFGCGTNRLDGWQNFDAEIDITSPLPFADGHADFIYAEHVVEHVDYIKALAFFAECRRVLKPGGVIRIAVPSLENIFRRGDQDYFNFTRKWGPTADLRGAMHAIIFAHGHQAIWSQGTLEAALYFAGFEDVAACDPGKSSHADLVDVEGHGRVIGDHFNWIETAIAEGTK
ncbi:methyltransferase domain-containing protein [Mesorhizobium sp. M00.F.Ca.ET.186.01.1.1]|nr:methyltransferase domain-containing protein [bacterium M00.F.Ca.ET.205.01.1.1]TGU52992.1 methyltransferase domain-containing protein [bacterium M00.F.Ca.ET.152.01.1.1]TGV35961.1 methyltransferase domain-containing protein [Mesorhizobium sp. M00.F.Ca.ET.186.01.1.1]TGZ43544.1 methyltransferase domain-containing protein [bacterium M00.F.Ca.ET.162.01.1.1]